MTQLSDWLEKAKTAEKAGCYLSAIAYYKQASQLEPDNYEVLVGLGTALFHCDRNKEALETLTIALQLNSKDPELWNTLGLTCFELGNIEEAKRCYRMALRLNSNVDFYWFNLGIYYLSKKQYQQSLNCFNQAILIAPGNLHNYVNKGASLSLSGRHKEAIVVYDFILSFSPNHRIALTNKAIDLTGLKEFDKAIPLFYKLIGDYPQDVNCLNYLASIYLELGMKEEGLKVNQKILEIDPVNREAISRKNSY